MLEIHTETVRPEWIDYNGHMNVAYYVLAFDHASDHLLDHFDIGADYIARTNHSFFVLETHVNYIQEVTEGTALSFDLQILDHDEKRLHFFMRMHHADEGFLASTYECLGMHIDMNARRSAPFPAEAQARITETAAAHAALPRPDQAGKTMAIRRS